MRYYFFIFIYFQPKWCRLSDNIVKSDNPDGDVLGGLLGQILDIVESAVEELTAIEGTVLDLTTGEVSELAGVLSDLLNVRIFVGN